MSTTASATPTGRSLAGPLNFPHTSYAEDQPLPKTILYTHVTLRAVPTGAVLGMTATLLNRFVLRRQPTSAITTLRRRLLASSARGVAVSVGLSALATVLRMWGREDIEWQDRSWRLLENRRQNEVDGWTLGALGLGGAGGWFAAMARRGSGLGVGRGVVGGAGVASVLAVGAYGVNRYGINGGMYADERREVS